MTLFRFIIYIFFHSNIFIKAKHIHMTEYKRYMHTYRLIHAYKSLYIYIPVHIHTNRYTQTFTYTPPHTTTYLHIHNKKEENNPIQMMLNKLYQMWTGRKARVYIPTLNRTHSNNAHVVNNITLLHTTFNAV